MRPHVIATVATLLATGCLFSGSGDKNNDNSSGGSDLGTADTSIGVDMAAPEEFAALRTALACDSATPNWGYIPQPDGGWEAFALGAAPRLSRGGEEQSRFSFAGARVEGTTLSVDFSALDVGDIGGPATLADLDFFTGTLEFDSPPEIYAIATLAEGSLPVLNDREYPIMQAFVSTSAGVVECVLVGRTTAMASAVEGAGCAIGDLQELIATNIRTPVREFAATGAFNRRDNRVEFVFGLVNGEDQAYGLNVVAAWQPLFGQLDTRLIQLPSSVVTTTTEEPEFSFAPHLTLPVEPTQDGGPGLGFPRLAFLEKRDGAVTPRLVAYSHERAVYEVDDVAEGWELPRTLRGLRADEFSFASNLTEEWETMVGFVGLRDDSTALILSRPDGYPTAPHAVWAFDEIGAAEAFGMVPGGTPLGAVGSGSDLAAFTWDIDDDQLDYVIAPLEGVSDIVIGGGIQSADALDPRQIFLGTVLAGSGQRGGDPIVWVVPVRASDVGSLCE